MADISDVEQGLVDLISPLLYPNGTAQPSALPGAAPAIVHRGWPNANDLDADLAAGKSHVSIWPRGGTENNTTRYPVEYQEVSRGVPTITVTVLNNTITIGGTNDQSVPQFITVQIGPKVVVSYQPAFGETLTQIATAIAALITAQFAVTTAVGSVIAVGSSAAIRAIVGVTGVEIAEIGRQVTMLQITLWCPTPALRDAIGKLIKSVLDDTKFLTMPDQSAAWVRYSSTLISDNAERSGLYRRDMIYNIEYATTKSDTATMVTTVTLVEQVTDGFDGVAPAVTVHLPIPDRPFLPGDDGYNSEPTAPPSPGSPSLNFSVPGNSQYIPIV